MEYRKNLGNLNLRELSDAIGFPFEAMLEATLHKKELAAKEFPCIVQYGDLAQIGKQIFNALELLAELSRKEANKEDLVKINPVFEGLQDTFKFVDEVLMEQNATQEFIEKAFLGKGK